MEKIRIMVVDDHSLVREGIVSMLQNHSDFHIVGEAESGEKALINIPKVQPNIVLMDIMMGGMNGVETSAKIKEQFPDVKVVLLSMEVTQDLISDAIKAGVYGYIPKDSKKNELIEAVTKVNAGEQYFSPKISEVVFRGFYDQSTGAEKPGEDPKKGKISKREVEVLKLIASGLSNREIADQLFISIRTVDAHRNHIMQKLSLKSTAELVKYAIRNRIIELE
ncbi:MAG: response regulator transcription factor [Cyclobacteriaceae bacterium]